MLSKCAHPACFAQFRYLHQGRIFKVRMPSAGPADRAYRFEHFWLCEVCAKTHKLVVENGGVSTRPMFLQLTAGKVEAVSIEEERQVA
jgi:hypothetical protein